MKKNTSQISELDEENLKLIYVLKIGYNSKDEGLFEFIFSKDETNIDEKGWNWDISPACDNAIPPTDDYVDAIISLKTKSFDLYCLHEAVDREYMHGYYTIHALAYEVEMDEDNGYSDYQNMFESENNEDLPRLVFHYGMTLSRIKEILSMRNIVLENKEFVEASSIKLI